MKRCDKQNRIEEKVTNKRRNQGPDHQEENRREKAFPVTSDAFFAVAETELKNQFLCIFLYYLINRIIINYNSFDIAS